VNKEFNMAKQISPARMEFLMAQIEMAKRLPDTQLGADAVRLLTGWSRPTIYRRCQAGEFPAPISRGRWRAGSVLRKLAEAGLN
jgi:predicted DNA-binding transcriptional regulator AlpA